MHYFKSKGPSPWRRLAAGGAIFCAAAAVAAGLTARTGSLSAREGAQVLRKAVTDAAVTCYAIEGRYPRNLQYIIDNYGVLVDTDTYLVSYSAYGENLLPEIRVYLKEG